MVLSAGDMRPDVTILNVWCFSEPLESVLKQLAQSPPANELRRFVAQVLPSGLMPEHEYLVLELAVPGPESFKHRYVHTYTPRARSLLRLLAILFASARFWRKLQQPECQRSRCMTR
jgi:hypothetical protein